MSAQSDLSPHRIAYALERAFVAQGRDLETVDGLLCVGFHLTAEYGGGYREVEWVPLIDLARDLARYL